MQKDIDTLENELLDEEQGLIMLPLVALRGLVVFPNMTLHFDVGRKKTIAALNYSMANNEKVVLVTQKDSAVDEPVFDDLYKVGVVCSVKQMIRIPNSKNMRVIVEGLYRCSLVEMMSTKPYYLVAAEPHENNHSSASVENDAYTHSIKSEFNEYARIFGKISNEVVSKIISISDVGELCDYVCSNTFFDYPLKQQVLDKIDPFERAQVLLKNLRKEIITLDLEAEITKKVHEEIDQNQKDYFLREEMRIIAEQLGDSDNPAEEADEYKSKIQKLKCNDEIKSKLLKECDKLMKMPQGSHEGTVVRNYIDKCLEIPFGKFTKETLNLEKSRKVLDSDHYGLDKVKVRIIEALAARKRNPDYNGQILCLYGPPGVGKTSIVKSLAKSMNRKYVRIALGGIYDESEIRGHRRTYIGSMPGKIVDAVIKSGVMNPIILLDEIDKLVKDFKGDPSSALLEALDPEQNFSFTDHYIDFPIDLSQVMFVTTANDTSNISAPLYDRMEIIELNSYTYDEKFNIAKKHLIKEELKKHGLSSKELKITDDAVYKIIESYTREAGVRGLKKEIAALCRKAILLLDEGAKSVRISAKNISDFLGTEKYIEDYYSDIDQVGTVNGLAWTQVGGTVLPIEVSALDGTGKIELTGNLGDVMKESAKTAVSYVRSRAESYGIEKDFYKKKDIHIHAPEAAVPKDGPSAGLALTTALISELCNIPIKSKVAMTGEISLKGKALPIGGLKEKSMAAYKAGCDTVIIPKANKKDLADISSEVKNAVNFVTVTSFNEVLPIALTNLPKKNNEPDRDLVIDNKKLATDSCTIGAI